MSARAPAGTFDDVDAKVQQQSARGAATAAICAVLMLWSKTKGAEAAAMYGTLLAFALTCGTRRGVVVAAAASVFAAWRPFDAALASSAALAAASACAP